MMKSYDIYCDESGNTGSNFLDEKQPLYVVSGWMIERNSSYRAKEKVISLRKENFPHMKELKGARLLKTSKGRSFCSNFLKEMGQVGCVPFFIVAEKRYCLAAKIVEAFFDSEYNDRISTTLGWNNHVKKLIAEIIYNISGESIEKFAEVHKSPSIANIKSTQIQLIKEFRENGYDQLAYAVEGSNNHLHKILEEEIYTEHGMEKRAMKTINYTVFYSFIQLIELFSRNMNFKKVRMIHDEIAQFQRVFPEIFQLFSQSKSKEILTFSNGTEIVFSTLKLKHFEMGDSKKHPLIQAGDILSSSLNNYLTKVNNNEDIEPELNDIGRFVAGSFFANDEFLGRGFCDFVWSTDLMNKVLKEVGIIADFPSKQIDIDMEEFLIKAEKL